MGIDGVMDGIDGIDGAERLEALGPAGSFIIQAPAGSGKTELLMQRFLRLLSTVERPEEILALTFTRKAAGEMQNRILMALERARRGDKGSRPHEALTLKLAATALKRDGERGWNIIENPGRLKVQTIDSFSASLVRQMPLVSGLGKRPRITEDAEELYREAAKRTVLMAEDDTNEGDAVRKALRHLDNSATALIERLVIMLGRRDQWMRHVKMGVDAGALKPLLERSLKNLVELKLKGIREVFPDERASGIFEAARFASINIEGGSAIKNLAGIERIPGFGAGDLKLWQGIRELLLTDKGELRKPKGVNKNQGFPADKDPISIKMKEGFKAILEGLHLYPDFIERLSWAADIPEPSYDEGEWEILGALLGLLPVSGRRLNDVFMERGVVDFQAVSLSAIEALGADDEPTDLMLALDLRVRHILVDEYQDTSRTQLALLEALTRGWDPEGSDGRTLFVVGDPMQSIYLFREAEVGLFIDARTRGIGPVRLRGLTLKANFRSGPEIVEWVNGSFGGAFPESEDAFTGSVLYAPSISARQGPAGRVEATLFRQRSDGEEAERVVSIIKGLDANESTAVLCRSRGHLIGIIEALKREGIGFRAEKLDPLAERAVVRDLFALLRLLLHPYDRVAWLAALRAPWCGLALKDLHAIAGGGGSSPLWELLNDEGRLSSLTEDGRARAAFFVSKVSKALEKSGRMGLRGLLEGLWIGLGGPACVEDESAMKDAEAFLELVAGVDEGGALAPPASLEALEARMEALYADHGGAEGVKIDLMTIHRAKGLEFDNVIIPGLGKLPRRTDKKLLLWLERGEDIILSPVEKKGGGRSRIYDFIRSVQAEKEELERIRLLYVAATRAKKRLYLFGHVKGVSDGWIETPPGSFLSTIAHALNGEMLAGGPCVEAGKEARRQVRLRRLPSGWRMPEPQGPAVKCVTPKDTGQDEKVEFYWAGAEIRHIGTVVHRYLCRIAGEGADVWGRKRVEAERGRIESLLRAEGLGMKEAIAAASKGVQYIGNSLEDERGRWILRSHPGGRVELPVTGVVRGELVHAVIDRTFVDSGVRWVIDYKTGVHSGGGLKEFLESEKKRYYGQLKRYEEILRAGGERLEVRKGLYYPALCAWAEVEG